MDLYRGMFVVGDSDDIPVFMLQRRTSDNHRIGGLEALNSFIAQRDQPVPTVGVTERNALGHFLFVGGGMIIIALHIGQPELFGQVLGHCGLSTSCGPGDDPDVFNMIGL